MPTSRRTSTAENSGFAIHRDVLGPRELGEFSNALNLAPLVRTRAGARHLMEIPCVAGLARHPAMMNIARDWLGEGATPFRATLFDKSTDANWLVAWHQDTALPVQSRRHADGWGPWSQKQGVEYAHAPARALEKIVALRMHLDDSTADNGPLRVLPATHDRGVLADAQVADIARSIEPVSCLARAGDVVAMRPLLIHASSKASSDSSRRVLHIEYAPSLELEQGLRLREV